MDLIITQELARAESQQGGRAPPGPPTPGRPWDPPGTPPSCTLLTPVPA